MLSLFSPLPVLFLVSHNLSLYIPSPYSFLSTILPLSHACLLFPFFTPVVTSDKEIAWLVWFTCLFVCLFYCWREALMLRTGSGTNLQHFKRSSSNTELQQCSVSICSLSLSIHLLWFSNPLWFSTSCVLPSSHALPPPYPCPCPTTLSLGRLPGGHKPAPGCASEGLTKSMNTNKVLVPCWILSPVEFVSPVELCPPPILAYAVNEHVIH